MYETLYKKIIIIFTIRFNKFEVTVEINYFIELLLIETI